MRNQGTKVRWLWDTFCEASKTFYSNLETCAILQKQNIHKANAMFVSMIMFTLPRPFRVRSQGPGA